MRFKRYLDLQEALKVVKKSWKISAEGYKVEVNDDFDKHDLLKRIDDRTNIKLSQLNKKMQVGIDYLVKKAEFFKRDKNFIALKFKKSGFTMLVLFRKDTNYIRVSSIFDNEMEVHNALYWDINEFHAEFKDDINIELHEIFRADFAPIDLNEDDMMFCLEVNERKLTKEVYITDPKHFDVLEFDK